MHLFVTIVEHQVGECEWKHVCCMLIYKDQSEKGRKCLEIVRLSQCLQSVRNCMMGKCTIEMLPYDTCLFPTTSLLVGPQLNIWNEGVVGVIRGENSTYSSKFLHSFYFYYRMTTPHKIHPKSKIRPKYITCLTSVLISIHTMLQLVL
ncbi:hypothetical protein M758_UG326300 [Ceratodon purpureus]|nr:hypothetical protein M758_UG326300 [Ceratodon purpureus]